MNLNEVSEAIEMVAEAREKLFSEIHRTVIGQDEVIEEIIISILARGHVLLEGVPGLGKTLLVKSIARLFSLDFKRIQFTPDLMPADVFGTEVVEEDASTGKRSFRFVKGPVFTNILLADEINRTPPKTQSALLEAMGEGQVTAAGQTHPQEPPFVVLATQNPIELEGTYPLPEAQLDRFLLNSVMGYLSTKDEEDMVAATTAPPKALPEAAFTQEEVLKLQKLVLQVPVAREVISHAVALVTATRPDNPYTIPAVKKWVKWGAGSRASQALVLAGKAKALLEGRYNVSKEDIDALAKPVLRHRIITNFQAEAENIRPEDIISEVLKDLAPQS
ncbi:MAG: MoxR family ATPase [Opitutales bacterium]|nr:MoxR family ATPase [Opitutales bacterium]